MVYLPQGKTLNKVEEGVGSNCLIDMGFPSSKEAVSEIDRAAVTWHCKRYTEWHTGKWLHL